MTREKKMFGASIVVNRALRPFRGAVGEAVGEVIADLTGATGHSRTRIIENTQHVVNVGGSIVTSCLMADAVGAADVVENLTS